MPEARTLYSPERTHLDRMRFGGILAQHARGAIPDPAHGVCVDDVVRLLDVDVLHADALGYAAVAVSLEASLDFVDAAILPSGRFRNVRSIDGEWLDAGSEDAQGRALVGLGAVIAARHVPDDVRTVAERLFRAGLEDARRLTWLRAAASVVLGCDQAVEALAAPIVLDVEREMLERVRVEVETRAGPDWPWPEEIVTYESALIPHALIRGGARFGDDRTIRLGLSLLDWCLEHAGSPDGHLSFIGNDGWWPRGGVRARFDQQPIEAWSTFLAAEAALDVSGDRRYVQAIDRAYGWFLGANDIGDPVAVPLEGAGHDALTPKGVNLNQGAESTLAWLSVAARMWRYEGVERH